METQTISEGFSEQISTGKRVVAGLFTTYNFEPAFFEIEVIPLMLKYGRAYSRDERIKRVQVREALSEEGLPIEVFYDLDMFHTQPVSPAMEYLHHGIRGDSYAFHAKLVMLLLEDHDGNLILKVGAGSANISQAGWWENIECQHWVEVRSGFISSRFKRQLIADLQWLSSRRGGVVQAVSALEEIMDFLNKCKATKEIDAFTYFGLKTHASNTRTKSFFRFLKESYGEKCSQYGKWGLEVISPYFADSSDFDGHQFFLDDLEVSSIRIFLPFNEDDEALCSSEYFEKLSNEPRIQWSKWSPDVAKVLGSNGSPLRRTHAKIYHFYNGKQSWAFVGSVNFTLRAIGWNQEAGFFIKLPTGTRLLEPINTPPNKWASLVEIAPGDGLANHGESLPLLMIGYDWKEQKITLVLKGEESIIISILTPERKVVLQGIIVSATASVPKCDPTRIEGLLAKSGFLLVQGTRLDGSSFPDHFVLVQQTNWTHKPLDLPHLTPEEIMQIYGGLNPLRRNQVIEYLLEQDFIKKGMASEESASSGEQSNIKGFFAEYAELFHAFRNLRTSLLEDWRAGRLNQVDYYLSGRGIDSLPTLIESLEDENSKLEDTTAYLVLLCMVQIYRQPEYASRPQVQGRLDKCMEKVRAIETCGRLQLINDDPERSRRFFEWFKEQFFIEHGSLKTEDHHAEN